MRAYSARDEERVRLLAQVREWTRSGLLDDSQRAVLEDGLRVDFTRTSVMLRVGLAFFTLIVVAAAVALVADLLNVAGHTAVAALTGLGAIVCYALTEWLVSTFRLYRYGVEEMLALSAVALLAIAAMASLPPGTGRHPETVSSIGLAVAAVGFFVLYLRFGFIYAAIGSMACVAAIPFQLPVSAAWRHALSAAVIGSVGVVAHVKRSPHGEDFPGDEYGTLRAAAWIGAYFVLNMRIYGPSDLFFPAPQVGRTFYWLTYLATWVIPAIAVGLGVRDKDRELMDGGIFMALATLVTNKPYLGWPRRPWDPILLGALLIATAVVVRRWIARAPGGVRGGFTTARILASESDAIARLGTVSVALPGPAPVSHPEPPPSAFGGGRSGGGGAGGNF